MRLSKRQPFLGLRFLCGIAHMIALGAGRGKCVNISIYKKASNMRLFVFVLYVIMNSALEHGGGNHRGLSVIYL